MRHYGTKVLFTMLICLVNASVSAHDIAVANAEGKIIYYNFVTINWNTTLEVTYRGKYLSTDGNEYSGNVIIPESVDYEGSTFKVTSIGKNAFAYRSSLTSITIPKSVTSIGSGAFYNCNNLYSAICHCSIGESCFRGITSLKEVVLGEEVTEIGDYAFSGCQSLKFFAFGSNVISIGKEAFSDCISMTELTSQASTPPACGSQALDDINKWNCKLFVPKGCVGVYQAANQWKEFFFIEEGEKPKTEIAINEENFPDANFRNFLLNEPYGKDGIITNEEILSVTSLGIGGWWIKDLKGIEFFTALEMLRCNNNYLTSLDVSKNTDLKYLDCYSNQLTSIDVSKNTALTNLNCSFNQLTSLDVSRCTALTVWVCSFNQLSNLDVSRCTALTEFGCSENQLTSVDVSKNSALTYLSCGGNQLISLDISNNTALTHLFCDENQLTSLDISNNTALTHLYCEENQLTSLDVSNNTALTNLACEGNQLTSLDVSRNTALTSLFCYNNKIKGEAMDALVGSLPNQSSAKMRVIDLSNSSEENVCTTIQVNVAKEKGWRVVTSSGEEDYEGSDQALDEDISGSCGDDVNYTYKKANHILTISGSGAIFDYDYDSNKAPWSSYADEIQKIEIESGITSIGYFAFYKCSGITSLSIPATVGYIGSSAFEDCTSLTSLVLNEGLLSIGGSAFESCIGLQTLSIPSTVNTISINAFKNCKGITDVYCYAENVPDTHFDAFDGTPTEKSTLHVPAKAVEAYRVSWPWSDFKEIVSIDADAIMGVKLSDDRNGDYYDLTGRRVLHPQKGIYIRNSKKVIVR